MAQGSRPIRFVRGAANCKLWAESRTAGRRGRQNPAARQSFGLQHSDLFSRDLGELRAIRGRKKKYRNLLEIGQRQSEIYARVGPVRLPLAVKRRGRKNKILRRTYSQIALLPKASAPSLHLRFSGQQTSGSVVAGTFREVRRAGCKVIGRFCELDEEHAGNTELAGKRISSLSSCAFGASARKMAKEVILLEEAYQLRAAGIAALQMEWKPVGDGGTVTNSAVLCTSLAKRRIQ